MTFRTPSCSGTRARPGATRRGQDGFTLAGLIVILTIIAVIVAYTVPKQWSLIMQRERERQTIFIMKQYARSIRAFQLKHRTYPVSLKQLQDARDPIMIRNGGAWPCPLTGGEDDWILVPPNSDNRAGRGRNPATGGGDANRDRSRDRYSQNPSTGDEGGFGTTTRDPNSPTGGNVSPKDYVGQFVGIRPKASGKSLLTLNGAEDYSEWIYTVTDLENELAVRNMELAPPGTQ